MPGWRDEVQRRSEGRLHHGCASAPWASGLSVWALPGGTRSPHACPFWWGLACGWALYV